MSGRLAGWLLLALLVAAPPAEACGRNFYLFFQDGSDGIQDRASLNIEAYVHYYRDQRPWGAAEMATSCGPLSPGNYVIVILGHANDAGAVNQCALSQRRGETVRRRLVELGLTEERMIVVGYGDGSLLVPVAPGQTDPTNRRVELYLVPPDLLDWFMSNRRAAVCASPGSR